MTVRGALQAGAASLRAHSIDTPFLDASLLLAETLATTKEGLYARYDDEVAAPQAARYEALLARRLAGLPVSYIRRRKEFYGREFYVDERVLIPRPDTELLVETALELIDRFATDDLPTTSARRARPLRVHDVGTGSGCIALTLALERSAVEVSASDLSPQAEEVYRINADRLGVHPPFTRAALLADLHGPFDLIVSNPPYLSDREVDEMKASGWPEPEMALRAGADGLDCIAQLIAESVRFLAGRVSLALECAPQQADRVAEMLRGAGYGTTEVRLDLAGRKRVVVGTFLGADQV